MIIIIKKIENISVWSTICKYFGVIYDMTKAVGGLDSVPIAQKDSWISHRKGKGSDPGNLGLPHLPHTSSQALMVAWLDGRPEQEFSI